MDSAMNGLRPLGMRAQVSTSEVHRRTRYLDLDGIPARAAAQPGRADARVRAQPVGRRPDRGAVGADPATVRERRLVPMVVAAYQSLATGDLDEDVCARLRRCRASR